MHLFVTSHGDDAPTVLSRVLYVELMSPEGYIIKTEKYRIDDNGTCHGEIYLNPEYLSGFLRYVSTPVICSIGAMMSSSAVCSRCMTR